MVKSKTIFKELGLRKLDGDEVVYQKLDEEGKLEGMVSIHVDYFVIFTVNSTFFLLA